MWKVILVSISVRWRRRISIRDCHLNR